MCECLTSPLTFVVFQNLEKGHSIDLHTIPSAFDAFLWFSYMLTRLTPPLFTRVNVYIVPRITTVPSLSNTSHVLSTCASLLSEPHWLKCERKLKRQQPSCKQAVVHHLRQQYWSSIALLLLFEHESILAAGFGSSSHRSLVGFRDLAVLLCPVARVWCWVCFATKLGSSVVVLLLF